MKINKYYFFVFLYFFLNSVGLPLGLLYTTLLTPVFYIYLISKRKGHLIVWFFLIICPFSLAHFVNGVDILTYLKSTTLLLTVYIFGCTVYLFIKRYKKLDSLFEILLVINFLLTSIAFIIYFTPYRSVLWAISDISAGMNQFPRLAMLTYEPSYYSTLLVPLAAFFFLNFLQKLTVNNLLKLALIFIPLILSFSLGVIATLIIAICLYFIINLTKLKPKKRLLWFTSILALCGLILITSMYIFYPDNPVFRRIQNVLTGADSSGKGRTSEAFILAYQIAKQKSILWGVGQGQTKIVGDDIIRTFYGLPKDDLNISVRIPCSMAETFAAFGIIGCLLRLMIEVYLFFRTKVYTNHFRTIIFSFIFLYQFTGSYISNIAELVLWILSFSLIFQRFNIPNKSSLIGSKLIT